MNLPCGKDEMCNPCHVLSEAHQQLVCVAVGQAILTPGLSAASSLAQKREAVWENLEKVNEQPSTSRMRSIAMAAIYDRLNELETDTDINRSYAAANPNNRMLTDAELEE